MSRISNTTKYPITQIQDEDFVLGSKGQDKKTRNFKFSEIATYVRNFFNKSEVTQPVFGSFVLGFLENGSMIKIPVTEFEGSLIGNLDGDYYGDEIEENTFNEQDYI